MPAEAHPTLEEHEGAVATVSAEPTSVGSRMMRDAALGDASLNALTITEYEHFVSFSAKEASGAQFFLQYRRDQLWLDEFGVWQVGETQKPFYVWCSALPARQRSRICPAISIALAEAATGRAGD